MAELVQQLQAMLQQCSARLKQPLPLPHLGPSTPLPALVL